MTKQEIEPRAYIGVSDTRALTAHTHLEAVLVRVVGQGHPVRHAFRRPVHPARGREQAVRILQQGEATRRDHAAGGYLRFVLCSRPGGQDTPV